MHLFIYTVILFMQRLIHAFIYLFMQLFIYAVIYLFMHFFNL